MGTEQTSEYGLLHGRFGWEFKEVKKHARTKEQTRVSAKLASADLKLT